MLGLLQQIVYRESPCFLSLFLPSPSTRFSVPCYPSNRPCLIADVVTGKLGVHEVETDLPEKTDVGETEALYDTNDVMAEA